MIDRENDLTHIFNGAKILSRKTGRPSTEFLTYGWEALIKADEEFDPAAGKARSDFMSYRTYQRMLDGFRADTGRQSGGRKKPTAILSTDFRSTEFGPSIEASLEAPVQNLDARLDAEHFLDRLFWHERLVVERWMHGDSLEQMAKDYKTSEARMHQVFWKAMDRMRRFGRTNKLKRQDRWNRRLLLQGPQGGRGVTPYERKRAA